MKTIVTFLISLIFFIGCGGGGGSSSTNDTSSQTQTAILLDSAVSGVTYKCDSTTDITTNEGEFTCPVNSTVYFSIGGITLGNTIVISSQTLQYITPANLYGLQNNNITDNRILNFIQLVQSLDTDNNATNGIEISTEITNDLVGVSLDISNSDIVQNDLNTTLTSVGKNLIPLNTALDHYTETLQETLNVTFEPEPYYYQQWYLDKNDTFYLENGINESASINPNDLLNNYTGNGVKIAIIDNGLDTTHEDLYGAIIASYNIATQDSDISQTNQEDNHGTAVTGIIGARVNGKGIKGIASNAQIIFLKYKTQMSDSETIELFNKAEEFGADIINCSWGTYDVAQSVKDKIIDLANNGRNGKGTIIVFAAGNDNQDLGNDESAIDEVISVGATNKDNLRTWYSNYGTNLDIMAPGGYYSGITTIDPMGSNGVSTIDSNYLLYNDFNAFVGTSASAPIVSAIVALILEKNPNLTRVEIENLLKNTGDKIGSIQYDDGRNDYYGYGKVNLSKAMEF